MKQRFKNIILNLILSEVDKVLIVETLEERKYQAFASLNESRHELCSDIDKTIKKIKFNKLSKQINNITKHLNTKTKGCTWYEIDDRS
jgi:phosphatidate phosphatase APP1